MLKPINKVRALVIDTGQHVELARRLGRDMECVYFWSSWESAAPKVNTAFIGHGYEEIVRVDSPFSPQCKDVDLVVFPDIHYGPMQVHFQELGYKVFGAGLGEMLEESRDGMKALIQELSLPDSRWWKIVGITELRKFLKKNKNIWVKVNRYRGTVETFFSQDYDYICPLLDEIEYRLGCVKELVEFICEVELPDRIEVGGDLYTTEGLRPSQYMIGAEIKDKSYLGVCKKESEMPTWMTEFIKKISPTLKELGYQGSLSTELRIGKDKKSHMIDLCCRQPSPPGELLLEFYENFPEIAWNCANGIMVDPKPAGKYGAEARIISQWADTNTQEIEFPKEYDQVVKLSNSCITNKKHYIIPQQQEWPEIGAVIGWGDTWQEAVEAVKEVADTVKGYCVEVKVKAFDDAEEELEKAHKMGLDWI